MSYPPHNELPHFIMSYRHLIMSYRHLIMSYRHIKISCIFIMTYTLSLRPILTNRSYRSKYGCVVLTAAGHIGQGLEAVAGAVGQTGLAQNRPN